MTQCCHESSISTVHEHVFLTRCFTLVMLNKIAQAVCSSIVDVHGFEHSAHLAVVIVVIAEKAF